MPLRPLAFSSVTVAATVLAAAVTAAPARADEGMWTFDAFPAARMAADYGWAPDERWLGRVRAAAVRLTGGCSASFVSGGGLILTNHHCIVACAQNLSSEREDLVANGFVAARAEDERQCPGQQAEVVTAIADVTGEVKAAIGAASGEALVKARDATVAGIEKARCPDTARTRCQVIALFGGGQYKLYTYRKYSDVRLVWAPEFQAAFFGGDPDNFNYPRFALDAAFLRAYENGRPAKVAAFLPWNPRPPVPGEATFVVGNPGSTQRLSTLDQLAFERELRLPAIIATMAELRGRLIAEMDSSPQKKREGKDALFGIENTLKVYLGQQRALNDPAFVNTLAQAESTLKAKSAGKPGIGDPWGEVAQAVRAYRDIYYPFRSIRPGGDLFAYARTLVQGAEERAKPDGERLPEYSDSSLPLTQKRLLDTRPIYPWLEETTLAWSLAKAREQLGADDPDTQLLLGRESPEGLAERLIAGSRLADPAVRRALWEGGKAAIEASTDPLIIYARRLDARDRELQKLVDERYRGPLTAAAAKLSDARFAAFGEGLYPDATFSLRISYGKVAGWTERGRPVAPVTTIGGAYERATGNPPYDLPKAFLANEARIDKAVPYDFVTTNDIIGGNSGSPVIDRAGTVIGTAFDGNIHSLGGTYGYQGEVNRTVAVSAAAVQEALETIYPAPRLVAELRKK